MKQLKRMKKKKRFSIGTLILHLIMFAFLLMVMFPIFYAFVSSFKSTAEILAAGTILPESWRWENYVTAWLTADFATYTFNSVWYAGLSVLIILVQAALTGYIFARAEFPGKKLIFAVKTAMMFVVLGTSTMYPELQILKSLGLSNSLWGLIVKLLFTSSITDIFLVRGYIFSLPKELDEAATIDGCSFIGIFFHVIFPLLKPVMATVGILAFNGAWSSYLWPMIVTVSEPSKRPLAVGLIALKGSTEAAAAWNIVMAGAMISSVPIMIIYVFCNKYFVKGITAGAVKG